MGRMCEQVCLCMSCRLMSKHLPSPGNTGSVLYFVLLRTKLFPGKCLWNIYLFLFYLILGLHWRMVTIGRYKRKEIKNRTRSILVQFFFFFPKETDNTRNCGCGDLVYLFKPLFVHLKKETCEENLMDECSRIYGIKHTMM